MSFFSKIFENKVDKYLSCDNYLNPTNSPDSLISFLKSPQQRKYLQQALNTKTSSIFKLMKRFTVCSLLLIYSDKFYDTIISMDLSLSGDKWFDQQFIIPYHRLIKKICASGQMYDKTKRHMPIQTNRNIDLLFYNIGLIKHVFRVVDKMALLGRYYKSQNQLIVSLFIDTLAVHAQKIYMSIRILLIHIIENHKLHLPTRQHQIIMKSVLCQELTEINQEMKKLFLDKYFYPLGKGIGIKLFKPEEQTHASKKTIDGIINDHEQTNRQQEKYQLQITLFPAPGKVNLNFYEQTLLNNLDNQNYDQAVQDVDIGFQYMDDIQNTLEKQMNNYFHLNTTKKVSQNQIQTGLSRKAATLRQV